MREPPSCALQAFDGSQPSHNGQSPQRPIPPLDPLVQTRFQRIATNQIHNGIKAGHIQLSHSP